MLRVYWPILWWLIHLLIWGLTWVVSRVPRESCDLCVTCHVTATMCRVIFIVCHVTIGIYHVTFVVCHVMLIVCHVTIIIIIVVL